MSVVDIHKKNGKRPEFDVYIGRHTQGTNLGHSKWANPFTVKEFGLKIALDLYETYIKLQIINIPEFYNLEELRGKRLGCWCITTDELKPLVCHGQILLKLMREGHGL